MYLSKAIASFNHNQQLRALPDGARGVARTLKYMRAFVKEYRTDPVIRQLAMSIVSPLPAKNWLAEAATVQSWVMKNIRYLRDVNGVETLQSPLVTLDLRQGDCDDQSTLVASLLEAIGSQTRFVAIGAAPGEYEHVYAEVMVPGDGWVSVETTEDVAVGWQPEYVVARMVSRA